MSELTVEQVEWLENYLITIMKPGSAGDDVYRYDTKPYDYAIKIVADWHRQREKIEILREASKFLGELTGSCPQCMKIMGPLISDLRKEKGPQP